MQKFFGSFFQKRTSFLPAYARQAAASCAMALARWLVAFLSAGAISP
jgi:hypothetical protein